MSNHKGGTIAIQATMTPIATVESGVGGGGFYNLTVRNNVGNNVLYFGPDASTTSGFLLGRAKDCIQIILRDCPRIR